MLEQRKVRAAIFETIKARTLNGKIRVAFENSGAPNYKVAVK